MIDRPSGLNRASRIVPLSNVSCLNWGPVESRAVVVPVGITRAAEPDQNAEHKCHGGGNEPPASSHRGQRCSSRGIAAVQRRFEREGQIASRFEALLRALFQASAERAQGGL